MLKNNYTFTVLGRMAENIWFCTDPDSYLWFKYNIILKLKLLSMYTHFMNFIHTDFYSHLNKDALEQLKKKY